MKKDINKTEIFIPLLTVVLDVIGIASGFLLSFYFRFYTDFRIIFPVTEGYPTLMQYIYFILFTFPVWILIFQANKMYKLNRNVFIFDELPAIIKCISLVLFISIGILFFVRIFSYSRLVFLLTWIIASALVTIGRYVMLKIEKTLYNKRVATKTIAIVGNNEMAFNIYDKYTKNTFVGFRVIGIFTKSDNKPDNLNTKYNWIGNYEMIPEAIARLGIQKLFVSISSDEHNEIYELLKICEGINVELMLYPDYMETVTSRVKIEEINGIPFMKIKSFPMNIWDRMLKRAFDIAFSVMFTVLISPFIIVVTILIKITSPGPVFYKQERVTLGGQKFMMYKFRSMVIDAEKSGPVFAKKGDERYTKIGRWLRKYSVDELPQFINVIKGDMSVVGPRPEREFFINTMKDSIKNYLERNRVKCGVTGWAAVNGLRGSETSMELRIEYDIYYIENWSLAFDVKIILKTLKEALFSKTAF